MAKTVVRCPMCQLVLSLPESSQEYIRCPCDAVLINPAKAGGGISAPARQQAVEETGRRKPGLTSNGAPIRTADGSRGDCEICLTVFTVLRRRHHCRNCGALVCSSCSEKKWPAGMMPESYNYRQERLVRVCNSCHTAMERFRKCCLKGGSIEMVRWLLDKRCDTRVVDDRGWGILAFAAQNQHVPLMNYLVVNNVAKVQEVDDTEVLQQCLSKAMHMLRRADRPPPVPTSSPNPPQASYASTAPVPASCVEEDEQLQMAIAASMASSGGLDGFESTVIGNESVTVTKPMPKGSEGGGGAQRTLRECVVCFEEAELVSVFVPCGHTCCCENCAPCFNGKTCPVCREAVAQVVKTYSIS